MSPWRRLILLLGLIAVLLYRPALADLADTIARVKPSLVVVGTFNKLKSPAFAMRGSGFVVGDGRFVHAPRRGDDIKVSRVDESYFEKRFVGARRYF